MRKWLALPFLALALTGCEGPITAGTVIERKHEDARTYEEWDMCHTQYPVTRTRQVYDSYNKTYRTEIYTEMQCQGGYETRYDDEDWKIRLQACEQPETPSGIEGSPGSKQKKGSDEPKCRTRWIEVDSTVYDTLKVGTFYDTKGSK